MSNRLWLIVALVVASSGLAFVAFGDLGENLVYYWTPTEMRDAGDKAQGAVVRLGGLVEAGSVRREGELTVFRVSDGTTSTTVRTSEIPPAMFREDIGVVVEGTLGSDGVFSSRRLLVKHDNQYQAPTDGKVDVEAMYQSMSQGDEAQQKAPAPEAQQKAPAPEAQQKAPAPAGTTP